MSWRRVPVRRWRTPALLMHSPHLLCGRYCGFRAHADHRYLVGCRPRRSARYGPVGAPRATARRAPGRASHPGDDRCYRIHRHDAARAWAGHRAPGGAMPGGSACPGGRTRSSRHRRLRHPGFAALRRFGAAGVAILHAARRCRIPGPRGAGRSRAPNPSARNARHRPGMPGPCAGGSCGLPSPWRRRPRDRAQGAWGCRR